MQYHGVWSHSDHPERKSPEDMPKQEFGELLLRLTEKVFRKSSESRRARLNKLNLAAVFQELHTSGKPHYHFPVLADRPWSYEPLKKELRKEMIFVEFSVEHDYYWTNFVYLTVPGTSPGDKTEEDLDSDPWLSPGHLSLKETLQNIPRGARACDKARVRRFLSLDAPGTTSKNDISLTDKDFARHVVDKGLRDVTAVQSYVVSMNEAMKQEPPIVPKNDQLIAIGLEAYMFKNQADLARRVAFAWDVSKAPMEMSIRSKTAWDMVVQAKDRCQCICGGAWSLMTEQLLAHQVQNFPASAPPNELPTSFALRSAFRHALQDGAGKYNNIYIYGPKDAGKSHLLKPLIELFGDHCFVRPVGKKNNYPLQEIFGKKICVLQDFRATTYDMGFDDLLVWFEGESFQVPLPQNSNKGNRLYDEKAPLFLSAGSKLRISEREAQLLQVDAEEQNDMMNGRFRLFRHPVAVPPSQRRSVKPCAKCFSCWMCAEA